MLLFVYNNHNVFIFFSGLGIRSFTLRSSFFRSKLIFLKKDGKLFALLTQVNQSRQKRATWVFRSWFPLLLSKNELFAGKNFTVFIAFSLFMPKSDGSDSLSSLFTKEQAWANRSCRSLQKSDREQFAFFQEQIALSLTKNEGSLEKTKSDSQPWFFYNNHNVFFNVLVYLQGLHLFGCQLGRHFLGVTTRLLSQLLRLLARPIAHRPLTQQLARPLEPLLLLLLAPVAVRLGWHALETREHLSVIY